MEEDSSLFNPSDAGIPLDDRVDRLERAIDHLVVATNKAHARSDDNFKQIAAWKDQRDTEINWSRVMVHKLQETTAAWMHKTDVLLANNTKNIDQLRQSATSTSDQLSKLVEQMSLLLECTRKTESEVAHVKDAMEETSRQAASAVQQQVREALDGVGKDNAPTTTKPSTIPPEAPKVNVQTIDESSTEPPSPGYVAQAMGLRNNNPGNRTQKADNTRHYPNFRGHPFMDRKDDQGQAEYGYRPERQEYSTNLDQGGTQLFNAGGMVHPSAGDITH
ncbi:hypothetical protein FBU59_004982 [Linderina macrospora]|uniref:Uncharacterized protein n=1 Tax=Linderina macrospora TaxID=4868 RepID=A0ACC1J400_9FUNG|nr:hypothetical protein FBU59_004982 [Linderina macrospora]